MKKGTVVKFKNKNQKSNFIRGRLGNKLTEEVSSFIGSTKEDKRMATIDVMVDQAHNLMLAKQGIIPIEDAKRIIAALIEVGEKLKNNELEIDLDSLDVHPFIEQCVIEKSSMAVGGKMHTAKSRNDQVVTDMRIYIRGQIIEIAELLLDFIGTLLKRAKDLNTVIMPGYTHRQHAQVTTFGHYLLAYVEKFVLDVDRFLEAYKRVNLSPLGAGALLGTSFDIDRKYTADLLGFDGIIENTIDAVSSRDFVFETSSKISLIMSGLSRMADDLIEWSTYEYQFVTLSDDYCDISSAMPQKRNPDVLEIIRAKGTTVAGLNSQIANTLTGLRTGYSKDLQEVKRYLWDSIDTVKISLSLMAKIIESMTVNEQKMKDVVELNHVTATDLTEYLVRKKNLSFREAYLVVGELVNVLEKNLEKDPPKGGRFVDLTSEEIEKAAWDIINKHLDVSNDELIKATDPVQSIEQRTNIGGPRPDLTAEYIGMAYVFKKTNESILQNLKEKESNAQKKLNEAMQKLLSDNLITEVS